MTKCPHPKYWFKSRSPVPMHPYNMIWNYAILFPIHQIQHHKQQVETGQQWILQADVLHRSLILVILGQKPEYTRSERLMVQSSWAVSHVKMRRTSSISETQNVSIIRSLIKWWKSTLPSECSNMCTWNYFTLNCSRRDYQHISETVVEVPKKAGRQQ
jgi:hypothetical protein